MKSIKTPAAFALAFLLCPEALLFAQSCDVDGVEVEFHRLKGGALSLQDARSREIAGTNIGDQAVALGSPDSLTARVAGGVLLVEGLQVNDFPEAGFGTAQLERRMPNIWEANFPRGLYEFRNKRDLEVELVVTVIDGEATHITEGNVSRVSLDVSEGMIHDLWWGGTNSLRRLRGNLDFVYTDIQQLARSGVHRATVNVCVNIRGHL